MLLTKRRFYKDRFAYQEGWEGVILDFLWLLEAITFIVFIVTAFMFVHTKDFTTDDMFSYFSGFNILLKPVFLIIVQIYSTYIVYDGIWLVILVLLGTVTLGFSFATLIWLTVYGWIRCNTAFTGGGRNLCTNMLYCCAYYNKDPECQGLGPCPAVGIVSPKDLTTVDSDFYWYLTFISIFFVVESLITLLAAGIIKRIRATKKDLFYGKKYVHDYYVGTLDVKKKALLEHITMEEEREREEEEEEENESNNVELTSDNTDVDKLQSPSPPPPPLPTPHTTSPPSPPPSTAATFPVNAEIKDLNMRENTHISISIAELLPQQQQQLYNIDDEDEDEDEESDSSVCPTQCYNNDSTAIIHGTVVGYCSQRRPMTAMLTFFKHGFSKCLSFGKYAITGITYFTKAFTTYHTHTFTHSQLGPLMVHQQDGDYYNGGDNDKNSSLLSTTSGNMNQLHRKEESTTIKHRRVYSNAKK